MRKHLRASSELREQLDHPVIDSDGHWIEFLPEMLEYLQRVGGSKAAEGLRSREQLVARTLAMAVDERRERGIAQQAWWAFPTRNTLDRATAMLPRLLYERLDELGFDFCILYPTLGLGLPFIADAEIRRATCRAFNQYAAEVFREFSDRMTPAAVIPMHTPEEAIAELEHAVRDLGLKVVILGSLIPREVPAFARQELPARFAAALDVLGLDSPYNYDPVWSKCLELKVSPTFHTPTRGLGLRRSPSNFTYNHIGHFAVGGEAVCKALFLGGVTRRFPDLKFAFLEGGVGWAVQLYADLVGHWDKRSAKGLQEVNPIALDRGLMRRLFEKYAGADAAAKLQSWEPVSPGELRMAEACHGDLTQLDDYAACAITRPEEFRDLFARNFYFGCEAEDPLNSLAFNTKLNPFQASLKTLFGSDIGHFDVSDMATVLLEAWELVENGLLTRENFRDFVFSNPVEFWAGTNPDFFVGTCIENLTAPSHATRAGTGETNPGAS